MPCDIIKIDCMSLLRELDGGTASLVFADPPFNVKKAYASYVDQAAAAEYEEWSCRWLSELVRILKPGGSLFVHHIPKWLISYCHFLNGMEDLEFRHWIAWDALSAPMGESLQPAHYGIAYYVKKPASRVTFHELRTPYGYCRGCKLITARYDGKNTLIPPHGPILSDVWKDIHRLKHKQYRTDHPCQLPVHLLERIILMSSEAGDMVVDPFVGTGATPVAAARLGRSFLGCDLDEGYVETSRRRVARQVKESRFNGIYLSCHLHGIISVRRDDVYDLRENEKHYRAAWRDLFRSWPDTDAEWVRLHDAKPKLKLVYRRLVNELNSQVKIYPA